MQLRVGAMQLLIDGPDAGAAAATVVLSHGAGAPMDSPFMAFFAQGLAAAGLRVMRFEFPYMAKRRADGRKRPPDRVEVLLDNWREAIASTGVPIGRLVIGGKSMSGRIASMVADEAGVLGLVCLGYPFHPPGKPEATRVTHLADLRTPTLIVQGTRDPLGSQAEVAGYSLSSAIRVHWLADGDHGFVPRVASGRIESDNWQEALTTLTNFVAELKGSSER